MTWRWGQDMHEEMAVDRQGLKMKNEAASLTQKLAPRKQELLLSGEGKSLSLRRHQLHRKESGEGKGDKEGG